MLTKDIKYKCGNPKLTFQKKSSLSIIGGDTEAYDDGQMFMFATSEGDVFAAGDLPGCFFSRKYRNSNFVCYNLSYDEGAILQFLPKSNLLELWEMQETQFEGWKISIIPRKLLTISRKSHSVRFYDMLNFFGGSLNYNSEKYLGEKKLDIETMSFTRAYVKKNWDTIAKYCIQDAVLVKKLGELIINKFEKFGVYPQRLYSTAYISYTYFRQHCNYVTVRRFWYEDRRLLDYALLSYNGGKFEITEKGTGQMYEYDIVSAYPYEIANLVDISDAKIIWSSSFQKDATYAFLECEVTIPLSVHSPIAHKINATNYYPAGHYTKVITLKEYLHLVNHNCDVTIKSGVWLIIDKKIYPYRDEIRKLVKLKQKFKSEHAELDTHTIKIFLNSLYGKFCQIIKTPSTNKASTCWNPIYASIITANTRIRVTELQQMYPSIIAVHTDSIISRKKLDFPKSDVLGDMSYECEGHGLIIGTGIYQIGDKARFRGFESKTSLFDMFNVNKSVVKINATRKYGWRECMSHGWDVEYINRFVPDEKILRCNFDIKRVWLDDYRLFSELFERNVASLPVFLS